MRRLIVLAVALAATLTPVAIIHAGAAPAKDRYAVPAATPIGKPEFCIPHRQIRESLVRNDSVVDFRMRDGRFYRAVIKNGCPGLGFEGRFGYSTSLDRLCASDIITVLYISPIGSGARCALGTFQQIKLQPVEKTAR